MDAEKSKLQGSVKKKILEFKKTFGRPYILNPCVLRGGERGAITKVCVVHTWLKNSIFALISRHLTAN